MKQHHTNNTFKSLWRSSSTITPPTCAAAEIFIFSLSHCLVNARHCLRTSVSLLTTVMSG